MTRGLPTSTRQRSTQVLAATLIAVAAASVTACKPTTPARPVAGTQGVDVKQSEALFSAALDNIERLEEFDDVEAMLLQSVARLNEWRELAEPRITPVDEPLIATLPEELRAKIQPVERFTLDDSLALAEATWLRSIATGAAIDPPTKAQIAELTGQGSSPSTQALARAVRLFDWVVRNIALDEPTAPPAPTKYAWQTLLCGRGTPAERATVFMLLARQQGLETAALIKPGDASKPLLVAVVLPASEGPAALYVFDLVAGIAWPGPGGKGIATLNEAAGDPAVLAQLNISDSQPYPWQAADLTGLTAEVDASSAYLNPLLRAFENNLSGAQRLVLHCNPAEVANQLQSIPQIAEVTVWQTPYRALAERGPAQVPLNLPKVVIAENAELVKPFLKIPNRLLKARIQHLKGQLTGETSATVSYQGTRPADEQIKEAGLEAKAAAAVREVKNAASYWLGLLSFERAGYPAAADYFGKRTIDAAPEGRWAAAARYNLARTLEAEGKASEAVELYQADQSPAQFGSHFRARRLSGSASAVEVSPATEKPAG